VRQGIYRRPDRENPSLWYGKRDEKEEEVTGENDFQEG